jgi:hypothetical protein
MIANAEGASMSMTRKQFLRTVVGATIGVAGVATLAACGGDDGPADAPGSCTTPSTTIGGNHGHTMMVTKAEVDAATAKTYDITGAGGHTHTVTVSVANFASLAVGGTLTITSTTANAHSHEVVVMCS